MLKGRQRPGTQWANKARVQCDLKGFHIPEMPGRKDSAAWMLLVCAHSVSVGSSPEGRSPAQPTTTATELQTLFDGGTHGVG